MSSLAGKRVLLIAPRFFGYEEDIRRDLIALGAHVDFLPDRPFRSAAMKAAARFATPLVVPLAEKLHRRQLERWAPSGYDVVLVINGQTLSAAMLDDMRGWFPRARFILYMWDSFGNRRSVLRTLDRFDDRLSFDRISAEKYGLRFRPLFFAPDFETANETARSYHLSFIGTAHTDRYEIISRIASRLSPEIRFFRYLYLHAPWVWYFRRVFSPSWRNSRRGDFGFLPLPRSEVRRVFFASHAVLDVEHPRQTGLTIRTLETVGASRKLVTTNARIADYELYQPENVCIIDRTAARIPTDFLLTPYRPLPIQIYRKYSLRGWTEDVLASVLQSRAVSQP